MSKAPDSSKAIDKETGSDEVSALVDEAIEDAVILDEPERDEGDLAETVNQELDDEIDPEAEDAVVATEDDTSDETPSNSEELETPEGGVVEPATNATKRGGAAPFLGFVLGGVIAAAIGFGAARYVVPDGWPFPGTAPEEDPLPGLVASQGDDISTLRAEVSQLGDALAAMQTDTSAMDRADEVAASVAALNTRLDEIEARLTAVEKLAPEGSAAAQAAAEAYDRELTALREMFAGELAKIEAAQSDVAAFQADAASAAQAAEGQAALSRVMSALENGQPYSDALLAFTTATGAEIPEELGDYADEGVPTLASLQAAFPDMARAALDASVRAGVEDGSIGRVEGFLRLQLGTRSLEPKTGDDPDAVLSRAEAALQRGDLNAALGELDTLPDVAQPALTDWIAQVKIRKEALEAATALSQELTAK